MLTIGQKTQPTKKTSSENQHANQHEKAQSCFISPFFLQLGAITAVLLVLSGIREASSTLLARVELLPCVDLHVGLELVRLVEFPLAVHALERLLAGVNPKVPVEITVCPEGLAALVALVRFLTGVNALVLLEAARVKKPLAAHVANKRLLPRVAPLVIAERIFVVKGFSANGAVELLVVTVALFVQFQRVCRAEALQTYLTAERLNHGLVSPSRLERYLSAFGFFGPVGVHVLLMDQKPAVEEEGLPTKVAHERFAGAMDEHVGLEFGVVREALATFLAGERLLARVDAEVSLEVVVETEPGPTYVAGERFLPRVDEAVSLQSSSRSIRPVAHVADKRRDARVLPFVHRQRVGVLESLFAHRALVLFGVGVDHLMEAEGVFALEVLATRLAAERPLF